jgi:hypothetical protein
MKNLSIMAVLLSAASLAQADPMMIIQNSLQNPYATGYNNARSMQEFQQEDAQIEQDDYNRKMIRIERQRNEIMRQSNNIQQFPQLYRFGSYGR